jgi:transketolase
MNTDLVNLKKFSQKVRIDILNMVNDAQSSHIGSCYSIVDIIVSLYCKILYVDPKNPSDVNRDKFILSKAHGSCALYATLAELNFFPLENLKKYYIDGGLLPAHLDKTVCPGVEHSLGSLGHGLPVGVGLSFANNLDNNKGQIYVLVGDGECNEGTIWESALFAGHHKLNNLTVIVDFNKIQSFGNVDEILTLDPFGKKWESFGWDVVEIDGHDFQQLIDAFMLPHKKPKVIIAHTVKGKGVSFMENNLDWHYKSPNTQQYEDALKELMILK